MQILNIFAPKDEKGMDLRVGFDDGDPFATLGPKGSNVLERDRRVALIDGVENAFVADVLFADEGDAFAWGVYR